MSVVDGSTCVIILRTLLHRRRHVWLYTCYTCVAYISRELCCLRYGRHAGSHATVCLLFLLALDLSSSARPFYMNRRPSYRSSCCCCKPIPVTTPCNQPLCAGPLQQRDSWHMHPCWVLSTVTDIFLNSLVIFIVEWYVCNLVAVV